MISKPAMTDLNIPYRSIWIKSVLLVKNPEIHSFSF